MFNYTENQRSFKLNGLEIGGQPRVNPTLMIGSIFYENQFENPKEEKEQAVELINKQNELSEKTSLSSLIDVFIYGEEEIDWKLDFALENINGVFSLDMPESEVRIEVLDRLKELDALSRVIYNSLNLGVTEKEIEKLEECTHKGAVLLAYNPQNNNTQGRVNMIKDGDKLMDEGILPLAERMDIDHLLLDTAATPYGESACECLRAIPVFKSKFGLPTGCALHNTVESWEWLKHHERKEIVFSTLDTSIDNLSVMLGADFIYYGPIDNAPLTFPNMAMVDKLIAEGALDYFGEEIDESHPYYSV